MLKKLMELRMETVAVLILLVVLSAVSYVFMKKGKLKFETRAVVYAGITISLAFVLSSVRIFRMPQGGSITPASMLPLFVFSIIFGPLPGFIAGAVYGFLQLIQEAFVVHWAQLLLDYPFAFASVGFAGLFGRHRVEGITIGMITRTVFHVISGVVFFSEYAPEGQNVLIYSIAYNGSFMAVETVITILLSIPVIAALKRSGRLS